MLSRILMELLTCENEKNKLLAIEGMVRDVLRVGNVIRDLPQNEKSDFEASLAVMPGWHCLLVSS